MDELLRECKIRFTTVGGSRGRDHYSGELSHALYTYIESTTILPYYYATNYICIYIGSQILFHVDSFSALKVVAGQAIVIYE